MCFSTHALSFLVAEETVEKTIDEAEDIVTPWDAVATKLTGIDYDKLTRKSFHFDSVFLLSLKNIEVDLVHRKSPRN